LAGLGPWLGANRGLVLDLVVTAFNLILSEPARRLLALAFEGTASDAPVRPLLLIGVLVAMFLLPACAATLKRWHTHRRLAAAAAAEGRSYDGLHLGCFFNPIFYFVLTLVIGSAIAATVMPLVAGPRAADDTGPFIFGIALVLTGSVLQNFVVFRYFSPPARPPRSPLLRSRASDLIGDLCIYLNMLLFQVIWIVVVSAPFGPPTGIEDVFGRIFFISFAAMLLYLPPRILYLAEDAGRRGTYVTLLLANASMIFRLLTGTG